GFIHGVMNTDNMAVSGETIDYGPCAFMDAYDPAKVFSSIDQFGRYAYGNQPRIALWNLAQLASCLLPLMGDEGPAIEAATEAINRFAELYQSEWLRLFRAKIGLATEAEEDATLIAALLSRMAEGRADFTRTFRGLAEGTAAAEFADPDLFAGWETDWRARLASEADPQAVMRAANPAYIPRNHRVKEAIRAATAGDFAPFHRLNAVLARPVERRPEAEGYDAAPEAEARVTRTFCGTCSAPPAEEAALAVEPAVRGDELPQRQRQPARMAALQEEVAGLRADGRADRVDDKVPHRVDEPGLLHVEPEDLVHGELEDFPERADRHREAEAHEGERPGRGGVAVALEEHEDEEEADEPEGERRAAVQDHVPPPEPAIEVEGLAEEDRRED